jgi:hypothetical protein
LTLEHNHPPANGLKAMVDIELVLGSIKSHESRIGEWVHVIGYVAAAKQPALVSNGATTEVQIQAILLWAAGPVKLDRYEELHDKLKAEALVVANDAS